MKNKRTLTIMAAASILTALAAFAFIRFVPQKVFAFNPQPDPPGYGLVGITDGQTLRVSVANLSIPNPELPPDPCRVVITFRDGNGNLFTRPDGVVIRRVAELQGGQSTLLQLNADNFARETNGRLHLRPDVRIQQADPINGTQPDPCVAGAEVFNNANGRTQFMLNFLPAVQRTSTPQ